MIDVALIGERPSREEVYLAVAEVISLRGTCNRGQVGAVITQNNRIVSTGYNGPVGQAHCEGIGCDIEKKCEHSIHAEANAIAHAARYGISLEDATIYCTTQPCLKCSELIVQSGIRVVYYSKMYTDDLGSNLLIKNGVKVEKV